MEKQVDKENIEWLLGSLKGRLTPGESTLVIIRVNNMSGSKEQGGYNR